MIKNNRQYKITKSRADEFSKAISELRSPKNRSAANDVLGKAQLDAMVSQYEELRDELNEYDLLKSGEIKSFHSNSFEELPRILIQARIAKGLTQKELAGRLGLKEQQIQRYEASDYSTASIARINKIVEALGISIRKEVSLSDNLISFDRLLKKLTKVGLERSFVEKKLLPQKVSANIRSKETKANVLKAASIISRIFRWPTENLFNDKPLDLDESFLSFVRFKKGKKSDLKTITVYTYYVIFLSHLFIETINKLQRQPIPSSPDVIRESILSQYGSLTLTNVLEYVWSLGIPVLPLKDSGRFHGAFMRQDGKDIIVLKQTTNFPSRWLYDLLHELGHAVQSRGQKEYALIEEESISVNQENRTEEEFANKFAADILLGGRAEIIVKKCVDRANGKVEYLKNIVPKIASSERVDVDALANYLAFRLSLQGINWWGAANNLQQERGEPRHIAIEVMSRYSNLDSLNETDRELLIQALVQ